MKTILVIAILFSFNVKAEAFWGFGVNKCNTPIMFYEWGQGGSCWAFDQYERACKRIRDINVCRRANPTYKDLVYNKRAKKRKCYELSNRGFIIQALPDSACR